MELLLERCSIRPFWGRGVMNEALTAVTDFCFDNFPLHRITAEVFANNPASARVLEKSGFTFEGRLKNNVVKDGELLDSLSTPGQSSAASWQLACRRSRRYGLASPDQ